MIKDRQFAGRPEFYRVRYGFHFHDDVIFSTDSAKWRWMKQLSGQLLRTTTSNHDDDDVILSTDSAKWRWMKQLSGQLLRTTMSCHDDNSFLNDELRLLDDELRQLRGQNTDPSFVLQTAVLTATSDLE